MTTGGEIFELVEAALLTTLGSAAMVQSLVGSRLYAGQAPDGVPLPYIVYTFVHGGFTNTSPRMDVMVQYQIECWAAVQADARAGAKYIFNALQDARLNLDPWSNYYTKAVQWLNLPPENDAGKQFWRRGATFEIRADKSA